MIDPLSKRSAWKSALFGVLALMLLLMSTGCLASDVTKAEETASAATGDAQTTTENADDVSAASGDDGIPEDGSSFIDQYEQGVQAYLTNEWEDCVYWLERAIEGYRTYYESVANCRIECEYEARNVKHRGDFLHGSNVDNLQYYELILRRTLCLSKCARRYAISRYLPFSEDFDGHYMDIFQRQKAYPYLYSCYIRTNRITMAASAAYTYLVQHPDDSVMRKSFDDAIEKPGIDREAIYDLEEKKFVKLLIGGIVDEQEGNWERAIEQLEASIKQFIFDENQCRAFCEGEFDHGFLPDFITAIGNHFTNMLHCKRNCTAHMGMVRGKYYDNLFARHYQSLQKAYYQAVRNYEESYRAGMSYLLFHVDDPDMPMALKAIESDVGGTITAKFFKPRPEAIEYNDRMLYEEKLADFAKYEFDLLDGDRSVGETSSLLNDEDYEDEAPLVDDMPATEREEYTKEKEQQQATEDPVNLLYQPQETLGYSDRDEL
ncbi:cartilage-associated protein-like isoform X1 [Anopheles albimanus]|uniref:cartilage-associated protein-like isoform X1 n=1 Tax=Anopheles albimanus TaxID=7167 RepID=UPI00163F59D6|nr:cartilage-associated protein-like isoform X1 [Anopheles albimanus]